MFGKRAITIALAATLVGAGALVFTTQVKGEEFERQGAIAQRTAAYHLDWQDDEDGMLRLVLDGTGDVAEPSAELSIFSPEAAHLGTFTLDSEYPTLDYRVTDQGEHTLIVHQAVGASVEVLSERGHAVELEQTELVTETIDLLEGDHADVAKQLALERDTRDAHMGLAFQGTAQGLEIQVLNDQDEIVLEAVVEDADTSAGDVVMPDLNPDRFEAGTLLVRLKADTFNGSLGLELGQVEQAQPDHVFHVHADADDHDDDNGTDEDTSEEEEESDDDDEHTHTHEDRVDGATVATIEPDEPLAFTVPEGVESVLVIAREGCGFATLYGPDDEVLASKEIADENGREWDERNRTVAIELPVQGPGEHVVTITDTHYDAELFVPGIEDADAVDTRVLETAAVEATIESQSNSTILPDHEEASVSVAVPAGLMGFGWRTDDGVDLGRTIRLLDPADELVYEQQSLASSEGFQFISSWDQDGAIVGPDGSWTVETEGQSMMESSIEVQLVHYVR